VRGEVFHRSNDFYLPSLLVEEGGGDRHPVGEGPPCPEFLLISSGTTVAFTMIAIANFIALSFDKKEGHCSHIHFKFLTPAL
jgi:hypothetical protein